MNEIEEMKISLAAKYLEVTPKTIYNWIEDGTLEKTRPGYVLKSDLEKAKLIKSEERVNTSRRIALSQVKRDRSGRFIPSAKKMKWNIKTKEK